jgi:Raf kinase inhibitor-like YbhB/YbcL family protein
MGIVSAIGQITRDLRAGEEQLILNQTPFLDIPESIEIRSSAFADLEPIPEQYTISGEDISPPLEWGNLPSGTRELVLIVQDFDVPMPFPMVHLVAYGLSPSKQGLVEGALPSKNSAGLDPTVKLGKNGMGVERYNGPAALPGHGVHHYVFQIFALSKTLSFENAPFKKTVVEAMRDHVLAIGRLTGTFERY